MDKNKIQAIKDKFWKLGYKCSEDFYNFKFTKTDFDGNEYNIYIRKTNAEKIIYDRNCHAIYKNTWNYKEFELTYELFTLLQGE